MGGVWGSVRHPWELFGPPGTASESLFRSIGAPRSALFVEMLTFVILAPLCSDSSTLEGPGGQVGATWARKSCPKEVGTAKMGSDRAAGGVRTAKIGLVRSGCLSELWKRAETVRS